MPASTKTAPAFSSQSGDGASAAGATPYAWRLVAHVDLDLVEPAGVHRQMDEDEVGPAPLEPLDRLAAAVGGAVVDDPEDAARGGVGLLGHHPPDESIEGDDPAAGFRAAEDARASAAAAADVEGGQVGERPSALVGVLDSL